jgi:hypothetical protein
MKTESKPKMRRITIREELWKDIEWIRNEYDLETPDEVIEFLVTVFHKTSEIYRSLNSLLRR